MSADNKAAENKGIVQRWFDEVWNAGNTDSLYEILSPVATVHNLPVEADDEKHRAEIFWPMVETFRSAFPDLHIEVADLLAEGDKVTARCVVRGVHHGDALGFAATGRSVEFTGITIARIENGQIVEGWNSFDFFTMYQQLGTFPDSQTKTT